MLGFVLYGFGIGMGYYPILKTTWKYFPEKKGFLTGLILCVFGLCPFAFTSISDAVINPDGIGMGKDGFYPDDVSENMKTFALIMAITMGACGVLSQILMFPIDNIISTDNKKLDEQEEEKQVESQEEINRKEPFMQAFKSWRFHMFNLMSVGTLCKY